MGRTNMSRGSRKQRASLLRKSQKHLSFRPAVGGFLLPVQFFKHIAVIEKSRPDQWMTGREALLAHRDGFAQKRLSQAIFLLGNVHSGGIVQRDRTLRMIRAKLRLR